MHLPALRQPLGDGRVVGRDHERGAGVLGGVQRAPPRPGRRWRGRAGRSARRPGCRRGRPASARATATRCACPPEISSGSLSAQVGEVRAARAPSRGMAARLAARPRRRGPAAARRSRRTVSGGSRLGPWKTTATGPGPQRRASPIAGQRHRADGRVVEARHQVQQRRLARAGRADERDARRRSNTSQSVGWSATVAVGAGAVGAGGALAAHERLGAHASTRPSRRRISRSAAAATSGLWVTTQHRARRARRARAAGRARAPAVSSSSSPVGSSASSTAGSLASATARPARASSPPESCAGRAWARCADAGSARAPRARQRRRRSGAAEPLRERDVVGDATGGRRGWPAGRARRCAARAARARSSSGRRDSRSPATCDRAAVGLVEAGQAGQQRRLARARRAGHGDDLAAARRVERDALQRERLVVAGVEEAVQAARPRATAVIADHRTESVTIRHGSTLSAPFGPDSVSTDLAARCGRRRSARPRRCRALPVTGFGGASAR